MFADRMLRRDGQLRAPRTPDRLFTAWLCEACVARYEYLRGAPHLVFLSVLYSEMDYEAEAARLGALPWWSEEAAAALRTAHRLARIPERDEGPAIEAAVAAAARETPR